MPDTPPNTAAALGPQKGHVLLTYEKVCEEVSARRRDRSQDQGSLPREAFLELLDKALQGPTLDINARHNFVVHAAELGLSDSLDRIFAHTPESEENWTNALFAASKHNKLKAIAHLIERFKGKEGNVRSLADGLAFNGSTEALCLVLDAWPELDAHLPDLVNRAKGRPETFLVLLNRREKWQAEDLRTIALAVVRFGRLEELELLVERGLDPASFVDEAIEGAIESGAPKKLAWLFAHGAKYSAERSKKTDEAIERLVGIGYHSETLDLLFQNGFDRLSLGTYARLISELLNKSYSFTHQRPQFLQTLTLACKKNYPDFAFGELYPSDKLTEALPTVDLETFRLFLDSGFNIASKKGIKTLKNAIALDRADILREGLAELQKGAGDGFSEDFLFEVWIECLNYEFRDMPLEEQNVQAIPLLLDRFLYVAVKGGKAKAARAVLEFMDPSAIISAPYIEIIAEIGDTALAGLFEEYGLLTNVPLTCVKSALFEDRGELAALFLRHASREEVRRLSRLTKKIEDWQKIARRAPPNGLMDFSPLGFKPHVFDQVHAWFTQEGLNAAEANVYAYHTARFFSNTQNVLRLLKRHGNPRSNQPLHDLLQGLVTPQQWDQLATTDKGLWEGAVLRYGLKMARLVKFASHLPRPLDSVDATREAVARFAYKSADKNKELAALCLDALYDEDDFQSALHCADQYMPHAKNIPDLTIPGSLFDKPKAQWRRLASDDMRGLFLGCYTDCCQHIRGQASSAAKIGYLSQEAGFYALFVPHAKEREKIVAQCFAWRGKGGELVLDSLESLGEHMNTGQWEKLVIAMGEAIASDNATSQDPVSRLMIGTGGGTPRGFCFAKGKAAQPRVSGAYRADSLTQYEAVYYTGEPHRLSIPNLNTKPICQP